MANVLHLHEKPPDYQTQTAVAQLTRDGTARIVTIGRGGDFTYPVLATIGLGRHLADIDLIHAWGKSALIAAVVGSKRRILYSPTQFPSRHDIRWLRAILGVRDVQIICPTNTMQRAFVQRGVPIEQCHLIRPGVDFSKVTRRRNDQLRAKLGFGPDDFVICAMGESTRGANHHQTILASTMLHIYDPQYKLLLWGRGPLTEIEKKFALLMIPQKFIPFADERLGRDVLFEQLLPAVDLVMVTADAPVDTLPIAICMAAGLPIIAHVTPTVAELLEDRHTCLMVQKNTTRWISRRVLDLRDEPHLQWKIGDQARTEAYEFFSMTRFVQQYKAVYEQMVKGKPVEVPQTAPGAGSRFAGRA